jgi:hypothetical protein
MAYESKIFIVEKLNGLEENNKQYAKVISMFDMCNINGFDNIFKKEADCYFYIGDIKIFKDKYDEPLKELDFKTVINYLKNHDDNYRRIKPLIGLLESFNLDEWDNLAILHYGY